MAHQNEEVAGGAKAVDQVGSPPTPVVYPVVKLDVGSFGESFPVAGDADGHLQVDVLSGGAGAGTQYDDGDARGTATGTLLMVDDGANIQSAAGDANGHLQVDVLTGGGGGTQYADGAARGTATGTLALVDDGVNLQSMAGDSNGHPIVVLTAGSAAIGTVTMVKPVGFSPGIYNASAAQTDRELVAAPGASKALVITDIIISNDVASADGTIYFEEDTAGAKTAKTGLLSVLAGVGVPLLNLGSPIICATNKNFGYTSTLMTTHSVTVLGYVKDV